MNHRTVVTMTAAAGLAAGRRPIHAPGGRMVVLRDGSAVLIRQVPSADAPLLADGFARLSAASRQMRFLGVKKTLSAAELRHFTDVDHHDHEALAALDQAGGHGVGIARYIRDAHDPRAAEIAVTIVDDWQGRGLGAELLARLSDRARQEGIRRFTALADAGNVAVAALLRNAGARIVRRGRGTVDYEITLARRALGPRSRHHHNPAATGHALAPHRSGPPRRSAKHPAGRTHGSSPPPQPARPLLRGRPEERHRRWQAGRRAESTPTAEQSGHCQRAHPDQITHAGNPRRRHRQQPLRAGDLSVHGLPSGLALSDRRGYSMNAQVSPPIWSAT